MSSEHSPQELTTITSFDDLVASRRQWIDTVLEPWCRQASRRELRKAEAEWLDIAGRADTEATLWTWAWSRHADLVYEGTTGLNETHEVEIQLNSGEVHRGYPDARQSTNGQLVLLVTTDDGTGTGEVGPFNVDDITSATRCDS